MKFSYWLMHLNNNTIVTTHVGRTRKRAGFKENHTNIDLNGVEAMLLLRYFFRNILQTGTTLRSFSFFIRASPRNCL